MTSLAFSSGDFPIVGFVRVGCTVGIVDEGGTLDLRDYVAVLRRRKLLVIGATVVVVVVTVALSLVQSPQYQAKAQLLLQPQTGVDPLAQQVTNSDQAQRSLNNEVRQLESAGAREAVHKAYKGPLDADSVNAKVDSVDADVISVSATAGDPDEVAILVNTYVNAYISYRREQAVSSLLANGATVNSKLQQLQKQIAATQSADDRTRLQDQVAYYQAEKDKLDVSAGLQQTGDLRVLTPALSPTSPSSPKPVRNAVLGLLVGLMLGVGVAFLAEYLDDSVRDKDMLEAVTQMPTLGVIPHISTGKRDETETVTVSAPLSPAAEAYRTLRTSVKFLGIERGLKVVQVTSASAGEGKTLTAVNLGVVFAQAGDRVLVVGCDLRRPRLAAMTGLPRGNGLTTVLLGDAVLDDVVLQHPDVPNLSILPTGPPPPNPSELLGSSRTEALLAQLSSEYDTVILDCPPLLPVTDSLILAGYADATLLLVAEGRTSRRAVGRSIELLRQVNAPVQGTILNEAAASGGYDDYAYQYGYVAKPVEGPTHRGARWGRRSRDFSDVS